MTEPIDLCPHFGDCGGCSAQDVPYAEQVRRKSDSLGELFAEFWSDPIPVEPSPLVWHYRNKVDPNFARKQYDEPPPKGFKRETVLGYKRKGKWFWPLDIDDCHIAPEGFAALLDSVRTWARTNDLEAYTSRANEGLLKTLLVRESKRGCERMVVVVTNGPLLETGSFVEAVQRVYPATSIQHAISKGRNEGSRSDEVHVLHGPATIDEVLHIPTEAGDRELRFRLSPFSFFQTNSLGTEKLYSFLREWVADLKPDLLYDLYGGSGGIAFSCADLCGRIESVEAIASASEDGNHNAAVNGIDNVHFTTKPVEHYLRDAIADGESFEDATVVADPPRAGLQGKSLRRLLKLRPRDVLYVSCKPTEFAKELPAFLEHYTLTELRAVDLFPHTEHVEVLARLKRNT